MGDLYSIFVQYCMRMCSGDDYTQKKRIKEHNEAIDQLNKLRCQMHAEPGHCSETLLLLLNHEEEKVRLGASAHCLAMNIHTTLAIQKLQELVATSKDWSLSSAADNLLKFNISDS